MKKFLFVFAFIVFAIDGSVWGQSSIPENVLQKFKKIDAPEFMDKVAYVSSNDKLIYRNNKPACVVFCWWDCPPCKKLINYVFLSSGFIDEYKGKMDFFIIDIEDPIFSSENKKLNNSLPGHSNAVPTTYFLNGPRNGVCSYLNYRIGGKMSETNKDFREWANEAIKSRH